MTLKIRPATAEEQKEFDEEVDRYTQPTEEAIIEYNKEWHERKRKKQKENKIAK